MERTSYKVVAVNHAKRDWNACKQTNIVTGNPPFTTKVRWYAPYEIYSPMVAILVAAEKATELPRLGKPKMKLKVQASQTGTVVFHERTKPMHDIIETY
jgi:hypothetical protein